MLYWEHRYLIFARNKIAVNRFFLRFRFGDRKEILRDRLEEFGRPFSIDVISGHYILRDRFGPSKHLKKTLAVNTASTKTLMGVRSTSFQAMNKALIFLFFQLGACLRMKFDNIETVGRLRIRKRSSHGNAAPLRPLIGFFLVCIINRNKHSIIGKVGIVTKLHQFFEDCIKEGCP